MNNKDLETLLKLTDAFEKDTENIEVPESLSVENITAKLKETSQEPAGTNIILFRRVMAIAAAFVFVTVLTLFIRNATGSSTVGIKSAFESFTINGLVKDIKTEKELKEVISGLFSSDSSAKATQGEKSDESTTEKPALFGALGNKNGDDADSVVVEDAKIYEEKELVSQAVNTDGAMASVDTVKSHGDYMYVLTPYVDPETGVSYEYIRVLKVKPGDAMEEVSIISVCNSSASDSVEECLGLYITGDTLVALVQRQGYSHSGNSMPGFESVATLFFNISDPSTPELFRDQVQEGEFLYAKLTKSKFYVVTSKSLTGTEDNSIPYLTIDGEKEELKADKGEIIVAGRVKEKAVMFITATDISGVTDNVAKLAIVGCGKNAAVAIRNNTIYITRLFASADSGEKKTEIYSFGATDSEICKSGSFTFSGSILSAPSVSESGYVRVIRNDGSKLSALVLTANLKKAGELKDFAPAETAKVTFVGDTAYIVGSKTMVADFADPKDIKVTSDTEIKQDTSLYVLDDGSVLGIASPDAYGKAKLMIIADGKIRAEYYLDVNQASLITSDSRSIVQNTETKVLGIPVKEYHENGKEVSVYLMFSTADGLKPIGTFVHEDNVIGDSATRALCSGDTLYTVSNEKTVAFSVSEQTAVGTIIY